jgi:hypothetical protein
VPHTRGGEGFRTALWVGPPTAIRFATVPRAADKETRRAEYLTLRDEEMRCIDAQRDLVKLNITASGAIAALAIANAAAPGLLVLLAFLSPLLGLLWIDLDRRIHLFARYVKSELWIWNPSWEKWLGPEKERDSFTSFLVYGVPSIGVFLLPAIAGLIVSGHHWDDIGGTLVWIVAYVPVAVYVVVGSTYLVKRNRALGLA